MSALTAISTASSLPVAVEQGKITGLSQSDGSSFIFDPYLNLTYNLSSLITLKASWGIYDQQITTLSDENEVISLFEPWIITPNYLKPASTIMYSGGGNLNFTDFLSFNAQAYYKVLHNIPTLNDNKILDSDPDLLAAGGESYGWEFQLKYAKDPLNVTASYTLSWAYKEVENWVYNPKYDTRHQFNSILEFNLGSGWITGLIWNYGSGLPFTQLIGYYDKFYLENINSSGYNGGEFEPYSILGDRNLGRLPDYHRLDISLTKRFNISFSQWEVTVNAINVYDRENIYYFDRDTGEVVNMLPFFISGTIKLTL